MSEIKRLEDLELISIGSFEECIETAQNNIIDAGSGSLIIHRAYSVDHIDDDSCICNPIRIQDGISLKSSAELFEEIEECQA